MEENSWWGLFKFFRSQQRLDQLIRGQIYCNTPEFYRRNDQPGVGDRNESVSLAVAEGRGIEDFELRVDGKAIRGLAGLTLRGTGLKDRWVHCWTLLRHPGDAASFARLIDDLNRIRSEFGGHYAYVMPENVEPFLKRVSEASGDSFDVAEVSYSKDMLKWSPICKSLGFGYQREVRLLFNECPEASIEPRIFRVRGGLNRLVLKDPELKVVDQKQNVVWLGMWGKYMFPYERP